MSGEGQEANEVGDDGGKKETVDDCCQHLNYGSRRHKFLNACKRLAPVKCWAVFDVWWQTKIAAYTAFFLGFHSKMNSHLFIPLFLSIADTPYRYVVVVILFSFLFPIISFATGRFVIESDIDTLIVPPGSYALLQKAWLLDNFGVTSRSVGIIHADGNNVISENAVALAFDIADVIPTVVDYDKLCLIETVHACTIQSITAFWTNREEFEPAMHSLSAVEGSEDEADQKKNKYILDRLSSHTYANGTPVIREAIFGQYGVEEDDQLFSASSFLMTVTTNPSQNKEQEGFENDFGKQLAEISEQHLFPGVTLESWTATTLDNEIMQTIDNDIPLVVVAILSMSLFTAVAMTRWRKNSSNQRFITSNFVLGLGATVTILLSAMTGYGFCSLCGVPFTFMSQMLPFVLFGIGIDDSFILVGTYYKTNPALPFKKRLAAMAHLAVPSITATTLTDIVAFSFGSSSTVPSVRWFCFYAAVCVFIDYTYQITFFVALLVIDHDRA